MVYRRRHILTTIAAFALALTLPISSSIADDDNDDRNRERLRRMVERGEVKSLGELRRIVTARIPGRIVDTDIDIDDDGITYEFRILRPDGRRIEVEIDAVTGIILDIENDD